MIDPVPPITTEEIEKLLDTYTDAGELLAACEKLLLSRGLTQKQVNHRFWHGLAFIRNKSLWQVLSEAKQ